jgi:hypothetical protein
MLPLYGFEMLKKVFKECSGFSTSYPRKMTAGTTSLNDSRVPNVDLGSMSEMRSSWYTATAPSMGPTEVSTKRRKMTEAMFTIRYRGEITLKPLTSADKYRCPEAYN